MTDTSDLAAAEKPERKRRFRIGCLGICACLFLLTILTWGGIKAWCVYALAAEQSTLRAAGEPVTWAEVIAGIEPIPDEENSMLTLLPHLKAILEGVDGPTFSVVCFREARVLGTRPSDEMLKLMRLLVGAHGESLELLHEASGRLRGRWPIDTTYSVYDRDTSNTRPIRHVMYILEEEADVCAVDGDGHGVASVARSFLHLGASLDGSPYPTDAHTRFSFGIHAVDAAERALALGKLPATDMAMLRSEFATEEQQISPHVQLAARGERASHLWLSTEGQALVFDRPERKWGDVARWVIPGAAEMDALKGLRYNSELVDLLTLPPRDMLAGYGPVGYRFDREMYSWGGKKMALFYATFAGPGFGVAPLIYRSIPARQRMHVARAALAVEQFRMERGDWPERLADLVPDYLDAVPQDWLSSKGVTISYGRTPTGVRIWGETEDNPAGLTASEAKELEYLAKAVAEAAYGSLPKSLSELVPDYLATIPTDPRTGKPYTYTTNPVNPDLFILGGMTGGMTEEAFWKQTITTRDCVWRYDDIRYAVVFRLLNPELRGAKQARFADEVDVRNDADRLRDLGYTPERLQELGFSDEQVESHRKQLKRLEEWEREEEAEKRERENRQQPDPPDMPAEARP
jgi:hypothetical protein